MCVEILITKGLEKVKKLLATMLALVMALTLCATAWAEGDTTATVTDWAGLQAAFANDAITTIDLNGATYNFADGETQIGSLNIGGKTITFQNGTFNFDKAEAGNSNGFFNLHGGTATFNNVNFVGNGYNASAGVMFMQVGSIVNLNNCTFTLSEEGSDQSAVLKSNGYSDGFYNVTDCTFTLKNTVRVFNNITLNMKNSTVISVIEDKDGEFANHALRKVYGTIENSRISVTGHETSIKNDSAGELKFINSEVALRGARNEGDLVLTNGASVVLDTESSLAYDKKTSDVAVLVLDPDGGDMKNPFLFANGGEIKADLGEVTPVKSGYKFLGWFAEGAETAEKNVTVEPGTTTNLTAKWTVKTSNVTINDSDVSSETGSATITAGKAFTLTETPATSSTTPAASATFNDSAATAIVDNIPDDATVVKLTVTAKAAAATEVESENQAAYTAATTNTSTTDAVVVSIDLKVGNTKLFTSEVDGAHAIVKVPYKTGMKNITVYYLHGDTAEELTLDAGLTATGTFTYDSQTGVITMKLPHFSQYLINAEKASNGAHFKPIHSGGATAADTVKDKAESPKTFDAGIAVYGVMAISSVLGMGYVGKKKF